MPSALEEKDAIREVLAEYCFRLDDGRFAEMAALFTETGTWDTAFGRATGRTAIAELARSLREGAGDQRPPRNSSGDQHLDCAGRRERAGAVELGGRPEQPGGASDRLGRGLSRRTGQSWRAVAVPLPQDRPLHSALKPPPLPSPKRQGCPGNRARLPGCGPIPTKSTRTKAPLRPSGGRGRDPTRSVGRVRWARPPDPLRGPPHPTLSPRPAGGEGKGSVLGAMFRGQTLFKDFPSTSPDGSALAGAVRVGASGQRRSVD